MPHTQIEKEPLLTVIVPVYKVEKYLKKCVSSIIEQSYYNLEIILVDDGSPDNCPKICDEFSIIDKRVRVIHKKNGGLSSARNAGIMNASGDYIAFVDSDDFIDKNMYKDMLNILLKTDADLCICNFEYIDDNNCLLPQFSSPIKDEVLSSDQMLHKLYENSNSFFVVAWNKIYKKELFHNISFPVGRIHEDEFIIHHVIGKCNNIVCTSQKYYYYVQRNGSIMSQRNALASLDKAEAMVDRYYYYKSNLINDNQIWIRLANCYLFNYLTMTFDNNLHNKRVGTIFCRVFVNLLFEFDFRAIKILLAYMFNLLPFKKQIKLMVNTVRSCKSIITGLPNHLTKFLKLIKVNNKIILLQTPIHGNIGDQAITLAEYTFLTDYFPQNNIIEIPGGEMNSRFWNRITLKMCVKKSDLVLVNGGGFLGTLWMNEEQQIQKILSNLYDRKIIILPQTSYYDNDENGKRVLKKDQVLYKNCKDLTVFLRERFSDDYIEAKFQGVKHLLVPDMVLWLDGYRLKKTDRKKILFCLRNDKEKTQDVTPYIKQELSYLGESFQLTDTVVKHSISPDKREEEVNKKIEEFAKARLIVTDRLHGMVLAAIAQTPCVVILSKSHKVKGVYEWIKKLDYIELVEDVSQIREAAQKVLSVDKPHYDNSDVKNAFDPLIKAIQEWSSSK